jgi:hypothetical protein
MSSRPVAMEYMGGTNGSVLAVGVLHASFNLRSRNEARLGGAHRRSYGAVGGARSASS